MNVSNFMRQHNDIYNELRKIEKTIEVSDLNQQYFELARKISTLAGKLQIHLSSEDKFLYPQLLKDDKFKATAQQYIKEMGGILNDFTEYKNKYNTKSRIENNEKTLITDTKKIIRAIENRMRREENGIYKLI